MRRVKKQMPNIMMRVNRHAIVKSKYILYFPILEMSQQNYYNNQQPQPQQVLAPRPPINEDFQKQIQQDWANRVRDILINI